MKKRGGTNWVAMIVFLIVGLNILSFLLQHFDPRLGAIVTLIFFAVIFSKAVKLVSRKNGKTGKTEKRAERPCPNPEPHRHFEQMKPAPRPNPEKPRVYAAPKALSRAEQDERGRQRRRENMRTLFEAGLLTREEYNYELERLKG